MRIKKSDLKWYVLQWDPNQNKTVSVNILNGLAEDLAREVRNGSVHNKSILREYLKTYFMYNYYSKAECEFFVSDLSGMNYEKVDMWKQIEPNLNNIVEYINIRCDLKF